MELEEGLQLGPLRVNLSKKGVGYSVGVRGFRVGRDAKGQDYSRTSVPGTGIYQLLDSLRFIDPYAKPPEFNPICPSFGY